MLIKTYCKKAETTNPKYIEPAVWGAFRKKWKRRDYGGVIAEYSGCTIDDVRAIAEKREYWLFEPAIHKLSETIADCVRKRNLPLHPVRYEMRVDGASRKRRVIGIEHPFNQVVEHVAVYCLKELYDAKIEACQYASIPKKGAHRGTKTIQKWVLDDNTRERYCNEHGYRFNSTTEYYVQGDIRKCYPSLNGEIAMREYRHDISKNPDLIWLLEELFKMHTNGLIIGSLLSQFTCNYLISKAVRETFSYSKMRRGERTRLVSHQVWYMDDFLMTGGNRRNLKLACQQISVFLKNKYGLELKSYHVRRWPDSPPDIMGFVVHRDGTMTIRGRTFIRAKRAYVRSTRNNVLAIAQARRIISMKGNFKNTDCQIARKTLHIDEISQKAQKLISDYDKGRLIPCTQL
jgi:RNA-directed DNA polymerase